MSFLSSLLDGWTGTARRRQDLVDLLLMAGLADGVLDQRDVDRLARAIETRDELQGLSWNDVLGRARQLEDHAPLFASGRARVAASLDDPKARRFALSMTAQYLGSPLSDGETQLLAAVAQDFDIPEEERQALLAPWAELDPFATGYVRCAFNDPDRVHLGGLFDSIANVETDVELGLLLYKLSATRAAMTVLSDDSEIGALGEVIEVEEGPFRVDAFIEAERGWISRFVARGEALHRKEHEILAALLEQLDPAVGLLVGFAERLSPPDQAFLDGLDRRRTRLICLSS